MYSWDDGVIVTLANWGPFAYMVAFLPTSYFFDVFGLRVASLFAAFLVTAGCAVRLLALTHGANDPGWSSRSSAGVFVTCASVGESGRLQNSCSRIFGVGNVTASTACPISCDSSIRLQVELWMHLGQLLNGLAGPVAMMSGPVLSAAWFPPHFRTTSTAIVAVANGLGVAFSNLVGPALVDTKASAASQRQGM